MKGKKRGKILKEIRRQIAENNDIEFITSECKHQGDCSAARMKKKIKSLGKKEVLNLLDEQEAEGKARELTAVCRFCNTEYTFSEAELTK